MALMTSAALATSFVTGKCSTVELHQLIGRDSWVMLPILRGHSSTCCFYTTTRILVALERIALSSMVSKTSTLSVEL